MGEISRPSVPICQKVWKPVHSSESLMHRRLLSLAHSKGEHSFEDSQGFDFYCILRFPLDAVYFFSSSDLAVSKRHELQKWALETHGLSLYVHDGRALAEAVSDRDVFWIAAEFLEVPTEIYPESAETDWYEQSLEKWKKLEPRAWGVWLTLSRSRTAFGDPLSFQSAERILMCGSPKCRLLSRQEDCWLFRRQPTRSPSQHSVVEDRCGSRKID